jgi:hypothetical protein
MKRFFFIFGILYGFFFAVPFPMIIYYNVKNEQVFNLKETNPWLALGVAAASVVLWIILLAGYYRKWVLRNFSVKRNIERLKETGIHREAKILTSTKIARPNASYVTYELSLSFKNLVDTEIVQKMGVNDAKPYEHRFDAGKRIDLLIDKEVKNIPYFIISSTEASINKTIITLINLGWFVLLGLVTSYYLYSYQSESEGMGWRFMSFGHPLIVCPAVLLFYRLLVEFVDKMLSGRQNNLPFIKFKGVETTARLIKASQTGTYINEQPMINFELEFTDYRHQTHRTSLKKIVDILDLDITKQEQISIFYLKEDPQRIAFTSDLNELS